MRAHHTITPNYLIQESTKHKGTPSLSCHLQTLPASWLFHCYIYHISPASKSCNILSASLNTSSNFQSTLEAIANLIFSISGLIP